MTNFINKILRSFSSEKPVSGGFSGFFTGTDSAEKKRLIKEVVKKANKDQKDLVERYDREYSRV